MLSVRPTGRVRGMGGWVGVRAKKKLCVPNMGLSFLALYSKFHCSPEEDFLVLGGWVGGLAWVGGPPVEKHIPGQEAEGGFQKWSGGCKGGWGATLWRVKNLGRGAERDWTGTGSKCPGGGGGPAPQQRGLAVHPCQRLVTPFLRAEWYIVALCPQFGHTFPVRSGTQGPRGSQDFNSGMRGQ